MNGLETIVFATSKIFVRMFVCNMEALMSYKLGHVVSKTTSLDQAHKMLVDKDYLVTSFIDNL